MGAIPEDALRLAMEVAKKLDLVMIAVDMLRNSGDGRLYIIERKWLKRKPRLL